MAGEFPILSFDQANPLLAGISAGQGLAQTHRMNPLLLKHQQIANAIEEYQRQQTAANQPYFQRLALANALKAEAEPREINARTSLYGAQTNDLNAMSPLKQREALQDILMKHLSNQRETANSKYYDQVALANALKAEAEPKEINARTGLYGAQSNEINTMTPIKQQEGLQDILMKHLSNQRETANSKYYDQIAHANAENAMKLPFETQAGIDLKNQETSRMKALTPYEVEYKKALAQMPRGGRMGVGSMAINGFRDQLAQDHPDWSPEKINSAASAYIDGSNAVGNEQLPELSGSAQAQMNQVFRYNAPVAVQNQAANMKLTASHFNEIPVSDIASFAGPLGKINFAKERLKMVTNPNAVSPEFRQYKLYQDVISVLAMDTLRKGFGTSVVPEYVKETLGKIGSPQNDIWNDPIQVSKDLKYLQSWLNNTANDLNKQVRLGVTTDFGPNKNISENVSKNVSNQMNDPLGIR